MSPARKSLTSVLAAAILALGVAWGSAPAHAAPAGALGPAISQMEGWANPASVFPTVRTYGYAYHVYLLSGPACYAYNGARVTWCGVTGNGSSTLTAGANFTDSWGRSWWIRLRLHAAGYGGGCTVNGNAPAYFVTVCYRPS